MPTHPVVEPTDMAPAQSEDSLVCPRARLARPNVCLEHCGAAQAAVSHHGRTQVVQAAACARLDVGVRRRSGVACRRRGRDRRRSARSAEHAAQRDGPVRVQLFRKLGGSGAGGAEVGGLPAGLVLHAITRRKAVRRVGGDVDSRVGGSKARALGGCAVARRAAVVLRKLVFKVGWQLIIRRQRTCASADTLGAVTDVKVFAMPSSP